MWNLVHPLFVQCGYDWYDEIDACTKAIENQIRSLSVIAELDELEL